MDVRFPRPARSMGLDNYLEIEKQMKDLKCKKEKILEELKREQTLLDLAKFNFQRKKNEFIRFLAQSSSIATQVIFCLDVGILILGYLQKLDCSLKVWNMIFYYGI